jgi:membrane-associated phospholipid phosphatase
MFLKPSLPDGGAASVVADRRKAIRFIFNLQQEIGARSMPNEFTCRRALVAFALACVVGAPQVALSQTIDGDKQEEEEEDYLALQWWHPLAASAGIATLFLIDEPIQEFMQRNQADEYDDIADVAKRFHHKDVFLVSSGAAMALGLAFRQPKVAETGVQILAAYGLSSGMMIATKATFGRNRPSETPNDVGSFNWFEGGSFSAFPSGAAAVTFSLATTLSDAIEIPAVTIVLYTGATLNSWARLYNDRHWLSDVALGALYGIAGAKIVNGRWRVFGWKPPTVGIAADGGVQLGYNIRH